MYNGFNIFVKEEKYLTEQFFLLANLINKIKAMDVSIESDDCAVEVTPSKKKKLKQGIFIFKFGDICV